jgi:hypothetical protein
MNINEAVAQALTSPLGIALTLPDEQATHSFRQDFYALRETRRQEGDTSWDGLAVVFPPDEPGTLHLVKKSGVRSVRKTRDRAIVGAEELTVLQLPRSLRSRGRAPRVWSQRNSGAL